MTLTLSLSPSFQLSRDGEPIPLKNKKAQALLVYLTLTGQPHNREHLATLLWGDRFDEQARNSLRQALFTLRKAVGDGVIEGDDPLSLTPAALTFEAASDLLPAFSTGSEEFDAWLDSERQKRRAAAVAGLIEQAEAAASNGQAEKAIELTRSALDLDPVNEPLAQRLMKLLAGEDRRSEAIAVFDSLVSALRRDLDIGPSVETETLAYSIRQGEKILSSIPWYDKSHKRFVSAVGQIKDLGGGETATFVAEELPLSLLKTATRGGWNNSVTTLWSKGAQDLADQIKQARELGAGTLITGTTRQIGEHVRIAIHYYNTVSQELAFSLTETIREAEAFEILDRLIEQAYVRWGSYFNQAPSQFEGKSEHFRSLASQPDAFFAELQELALVTFTALLDRKHFEEFNLICDVAMEHFPNNENAITFKAWVVFYMAQYGDCTDRVAEFRKSLDLLDHALTISPDHGFASLGRLIVATWFGLNEEVEKEYRQRQDTGVFAELAHPLLAISLAFRGQDTEAKDRLFKAIKVEAGQKRRLMRHGVLSLVHFNLGEFNDAQAQAEICIGLSREYWLAHVIRIAALERLDRHEEAVQAIAEFHEHFTDPRISHFDFIPITDPDRKQALFDALREAGLPE